MGFFDSKPEEKKFKNFQSILSLALRLDERSLKRLYLNRIIGFYFLIWRSDASSCPFFSWTHLMNYSTFIFFNGEENVLVRWRAWIRLFVWDDLLLLTIFLQWNYVFNWLLDKKLDLIFRRDMILYLIAALTWSVARTRKPGNPSLYVSTSSVNRHQPESFNAPLKVKRTFIRYPGVFCHNSSADSSHLFICRVFKTLPLHNYSRLKFKPELTSEFYKKKLSNKAFNSLCIYMKVIIMIIIMSGIKLKF